MQSTHDSSARAWSELSDNIHITHSQTSALAKHSAQLLAYAKHMGSYVAIHGHAYLLLYMILLPVLWPLLKHMIQHPPVRQETRGQVTARAAGVQHVAQAVAAVAAVASQTAQY